MAKTTISDYKRSSKLEDIKPYKQKISNKSSGTLEVISNLSPTSLVVLDIKPKSLKFKTINYSKKVNPKNILPFKLRITNIGIDGVDPGNPPGIGIQIIGFSNYIL
jgi:hypothetical protein